VLIADVNVFLYAHRLDSARHDEYRSWLERALVAREPFGVSESVLASFVRICTNHRVYRDPTPPEVALDFCAAVLDSASAVPVRPGARHWAIFDDLCRQLAARANVVPDAYLAAIAMEHDATWVTTDRGFGRFAGLRWRTPFAPPGG
jgi:uncharacterized protein